MATMAEVINSLATRGVTFQVSGDGRLLVSGANKLTDREKAALKANKASIINALSSHADSSDSGQQSPSYRLEALDGLPLLLDDRKFIRRKLRLLPAMSHEKIFRIYRNRFINGMEAEPAKHRKDNAGRYRANTWLLAITEKAIKG